MSLKDVFIKGEKLTSHVIDLLSIESVYLVEYRPLNELLVLLQTLSASALEALLGIHASSRSRIHNEEFLNDFQAKATRNIETLITLPFKLDKDRYPLFSFTFSHAVASRNASIEYD